MLNIKKGQILISNPSLADPTFFKSVIILTHHSKDESIGLVINQPTNFYLDDIIDDVPKERFPVYIGGPVEKNSIQYIHTLGNQITNSSRITKNLYWGGDFNQIVTLMKENKISKDHIRFFVGYSGWGENQLNIEINEKSWIIDNLNVESCMKYSTDQLWTELIKIKDKDYAIWANLPKDPYLN